MATPPKNIVIVGGSLGGLFVGVALKHLRKDLNIRILERNPTPLLHDQGAGVVAGEDVQAFFRTHDRTRTPLTVPSHERIYLDIHGNIIDREEHTQHMTSWDLLYHVLRANFDSVDSPYAKAPPTDDTDTTVTYSHGHLVDSIEAADDPSTPLFIRTSTSHGETATFPADLLVGADGPSSTVRAALVAPVPRTYAGYVAWRGTVPESHLSQPTLSLIQHRFVFFHGPGTQILAYIIPGAAGSLEPGKRLVNWVWYVNSAAGSADHTALMTDTHGTTHHVTLPAGGVRRDIWTAQQERARTQLPPSFGELVKRTETPFVQAVTDVLAPRAVAAGARAVLVGDALAGFRPHTAGSTNQAALDAGLLCESVVRVFEGREKVEVFGAWEGKVLACARGGVKKGVEMGRRSQFGVHPLRGA